MKHVPWHCGSSTNEFERTKGSSPIDIAKLGQFCQRQVPQTQLWQLYYEFIWGNLSNLGWQTYQPFFRTNNSMQPRGTLAAHWTQCCERWWQERTTTWQIGDSSSVSSNWLQTLYMPRSVLRIQMGLQVISSLFSGMCEWLTEIIYFKLAKKLA